MTDATPEVTLREVTRETLYDIFKLKVSPEQERFVSPNEISIAEAHFSPDVAWFRAIYHGDTPVGFLMLRDDPSKPEYYLWRFMIDARYQKTGVGRRALELLFEHVRTRTGADALYTSVVDGDGGPGPFYERLGFAYTGEVDDGELVMRREL